MEDKLFLVKLFLVHTRSIRDDQIIHMHRMAQALFSSDGREFILDTTTARVSSGRPQIPNLNPIGVIPHIRIPAGSRSRNSI
jgi:hypothetical protein